MADKTVSIGVTDPQTNEDLSLTFQHVTEVKPNEELESDSTATFDGPVVRGTDKPSYSIDVSYLDLTRTTTEMSAMDTYTYLHRILRLLRNNHGTLNVSEIVRPKGEAPFKVTETYGGVLLSSNEHTISAEDLTARDLSFSAEDCNENVTPANE